MYFIYLSHFPELIYYKFITTRKFSVIKCAQYMYVYMKYTVQNIHNANDKSQLHQTQVFFLKLI